MVDEIDFIFAPEDEVSGIELDIQEFWNVLLVDDDTEVHTFTKIALEDFIYDGKSIHFISAYSAKEAKERLQEYDDIALVLLDVVMESDSAGLELVDVIRKELHNNLIRIIIRTGQAGVAPEHYVIDHYDINDYKEKTELTTEKLYTTVRTALSQYAQLTELNSKKNEIFYTLITDSLTSLGNRVKLNYDINKFDMKSLILLNIDSFSMMNDVYGFEFGDELLKQFSKHIQKNIKKDIWDVYRLEADIFALLSSEVQENDILSLVNSLQESIANHTFSIKGIDYRINVTIGLAEQESGNVIQKAEFALHEARKVSRNRVQKYSDELVIIKQIETNTKWTQWLKEAFEEDRVIAYFQPIVDCKTDKVVKYETLVRLEKDSEIYTPFYFLETARYAGLLHEITKKMLVQACEKFSGRDMPFSINISNQDLMEKGVIEFFETTRKKYNIARENISLEILEDKNIFENPVAEKNLKELESMGYKLCLDDFGVQCSNFAQVGSLGLECIKIDGCYIKDIDTNPSSLRVTDSILYFTKKLEVSTIAEYVHNKEIYEYVKSMGVDYAQGYYLGKPSPVLLDE